MGAACLFILGRLGIKVDLLPDSGLVAAWPLEAVTPEIAFLIERHASEMAGVISGEIDPTFPFIPQWPRGSEPSADARERVHQFLGRYAQTGDAGNLLVAVGFARDIARRQEHQLDSITQQTAPEETL